MAPSKTPRASSGLPSWAPPASQVLVPGSMVADRYRIAGLLGEGATGNVYAAQRLSDGLEVALKVLHPHLIANRQVSQRFHREASILHRLTGSHIVRVHDFGEDAAGGLFMALERVEGQPLDVIVQQRQELSLPQVRAIMLALCEALTEAHAAGVVHRDLKPGNVIVDINGEVVRQVHVLDFGMSKVLRGDGPASMNLTEQNMVLGTPEYMAPEQARGDESDGRGDIYAAGVILYELLVGAVPFSRRTPVAVMTAHLTEPPPLPQTRRSGIGIPLSLKAVIEHAMAKDRHDRYATAEDLAAALRQAFHAPEDVASVRPPPTDRDSLPFRDTEIGVGLSDTLAVPTVGSPAKASPTRVPSWLPVAMVAGLLGIVLGVLAALRC